MTPPRRQRWHRTPQEADELMPYGRLLSPDEAHRFLGIPASTVRTWHHRRQRTGLYSGGLDRYRRPLFYEADLLAMKIGKRVRDKQGRRHHTMDDVRKYLRSPGAEASDAGTDVGSRKGSPTCPSVGDPKRATSTARDPASKRKPST